MAAATATLCTQHSSGVALAAYVNTYRKICMLPLQYTAVYSGPIRPTWPAVTSQKKGITCMHARVTCGPMVALHVVPGQHLYGSCECKAHTPGCDYTLKQWPELADTLQTTTHYTGSDAKDIWGYNRKSSSLTTTTAQTLELSITHLSVSMVPCHNLAHVAVRSPACAMHLIAAHMLAASAGERCGRHCQSTT